MLYQYILKFYINLFSTSDLLLVIFLVILAIYLTEGLLCFI